MCVCVFVCVCVCVCAGVSVYVCMYVCMYARLYGCVPNFFSVCLQKKLNNVYILYIKSMPMSMYIWIGLKHTRLRIRFLFLYERNIAIILFKSSILTLMLPMVCLGSLIAQPRIRPLLCVYDEPSFVGRPASGPAVSEVPRTRNHPSNWPSEDVSSSLHIYPGCRHSARVRKLQP